MGMQSVCMCIDMTKPDTELIVYPSSLSVFIPVTTLANIL